MMASGKIEFLDASLWDVLKEPEEEEEYKGRPLIDWVTDLERHGTRLGVIGRITAPRVIGCMEKNPDFVMIARSAILHHDFPRRAMTDPAFEAMTLPVRREYLYEQGVSNPFIGYLSRWDFFGEDAAVA